MSYLSARIIVLASALVSSMASAQNVSTRADSVPCEPALSGVVTTCDWLSVGGRYDVRSIVTRPTSVAGRVPALLFVQWLSCDPITVSAEVSDGWTDVLRALIQRSRMVVVRTEKPGIGGSGGPACSELGYDEEVEVHRAALSRLRSMPGVHADSIFVFGGSMGGTIAPLLASASGVKGVIVAGSTASTWLEHMIALDRRVLHLRGVPADSVHRLMADHIVFHSRYLGAQMTPAAIGNASGAPPVWRRMIGTDSLMREHYGRPIRFHHEAQRQNWPRAWASVTAPVLIVQGENDWIMPADEHRLILRALSPQARAQATYLERPGMGHDFLTYASMEDSFRGRNGRFEPAVADSILAWLQARRRR